MLSITLANGETVEVDFNASSTLTVANFETRDGRRVERQQSFAEVIGIRFVEQTVADVTPAAEPEAAEAEAAEPAAEATDEPATDEPATGDEQQA